MRKLAVLMILALLVGMFGSVSPVMGVESKELTVYTYNSFVSYGLANATIPEFEKVYGVKVNVITLGDAGEVLNRLILEKGNPQADVVIGIDNSLAAKAIAAGVLDVYKPPNINVVPKDLIDALDPTYHLIPYDYGAIAIVYKKNQVKNPPRTFEDLLNPRWRKSLILEDPRTSSTGMAFLLWTIAAYGDPGWLYYWEKLKPQIYQITKGWDAGWEMWDKGEAPLFLSYATDPAYDAYYYTNGSEPNIGAVLLNNTAYVQVEGVGIVKGCKHPALARKFVEFVLSNEFQREVPLHNWMFPASKNVGLPEVYKYAAKPGKVIDPKPGEIKANYNKWLQEWTELMVEGKSPEEIIKEHETKTSSGKGVCGPASILGITLIPLLFRKRH